jgi:hypothetical protein
MTPLRASICLLVLPALPALTLVLINVGLPVMGDRIVALILAGLVAVTGSATVALASERPTAVALGYAIVTAALSIAGVVVTIAVLFAAGCGNGWSC